MNRGIPARRFSKMKLHTAAMMKNLVGFGDEDGRGMGRLLSFGLGEGALRNRSHSNIMMAKNGCSMICSCCR